jgi:hypothetical protein
MNELFVFFASEVAVAAALVGLVLRGRGHIGSKLTALSLGGVAMLTSWLALTDLLSRPKPFILERRPALMGDALVLAGRIVENEAIHVWLQLDGTSEPRDYTLPWDRQRAEELQRVLEEVAQDGGAARLRLSRRQANADQEPVFHVEPPPPSPAKTVPPGSG